MIADCAKAELNSVVLYGRTGKRRLEASFARAFRRLGWNVARYDAEPGARDLKWWLRSRLGRRVTRRNLSLRQWGARRRNYRLRKMVSAVHPDFVLLIDGAFVMPETVEEIRDSNVPVVVFHPDAPVPENRNYRPEHLPVARAADICLIWSRQLKDRLEREGVENVIYLPFAWDPKVFPHMKKSPNHGPQVIFVGGWDRHRERWLEPVAERFQLEIWGPDYWGTRTPAGSPLRACWRGRPLHGAKASQALVQADIALNVLRKQNLPDGTNMRTFEVPGAGGFLLATRTCGAREIYTEGESGSYFRSQEELNNKIEYYLNHPDERQRIARRAHEVTARKHRYVHRARRIIEIIKEQSG